MFGTFRRAKRRDFTSADRRMLRQSLLLSGSIASRQVHALERLRTLADAEFRVTSQWGEDGIIEWLCHFLPDIPPSFVEFGVENYTEANTRFLLQNRGWRGLVMDASAKRIEQVRSEDIYWRHSLTALAAFVTTDNINDLIDRAGFSGDIGILSIDIDGNDYWILDATRIVRPAILIIEVNTAFGDRHAITIPYQPLFSRLAAHPSGQYFGASIRAMKELAARKGFRFVGTSSSGVNAFFVRDDLASSILDRLDEARAWPGRHRDTRDAQGKLSHIGGEARAALVGTLTVRDLASDRDLQLQELFPLSSENWYDK